MHDLRLVAATVIALVAGVLAWKAYELVLRHLARLRRDQLHTREHDGVVRDGAVRTPMNLPSSFQMFAESVSPGNTTPANRAP